MALSARELILILRATNQASGPIRQVSRDLRSLSATGTRAFGQSDVAAQKMQRRWASIGLAGAILRDTGRSARIMGIATGAGLGFAATGYAEFSKQTRLAATQTGDFRSSLGRSSEEMQRNAQILERGVLAQMGRFPASAKEMNAALYEIFSSTQLGSQGLKGVRRGLKLLDVMNKAAVAGQADLSDVTSATTTVMNAFGDNINKIPQRLQRMFAAVRFGRMTFPDFIATFSQIVPATQAAGQSFDTMVGTMAALTRVMPNVRMAATAYARLLEIIGRKAFVTGAKEWGMTITDTHGKLLPLNKIVAEFNRTVAEAPEKERANLVRNFFKEISRLGEGTKSGFEATVQARRALVLLMRNFPLYQQVLGQVTTDNTEFTKSFRTMASTAGVQWETFVNKMRATFLKLGAAAIPILLQLVQPLQQLAEWLIKLDDETRAQYVRWIAIAAAIAIVGGSIASLVGNLVTIIAPFKAAGGSLSLLLAGVVALSAALLILTGHGDMVKAAFSNIMDAATSSVQSFIVSVGVLLLLIPRLVRAIAALKVVGAAASMMGIGAAGRGRVAARAPVPTVIPGIIDPRTGKEFQRTMATATRGAVGLRGALTGAGAAAAGIAVAFWPTIAILGAAGAAALLWKRHQAGVAEEAQRTRNQLLQIQAPRVAAMRMQGLGENIVNLREAEINLKLVRREIEATKKSMQGMTGAQREQMQLRLGQLYVDQARAVANLNTSYDNVRVGVGAFTDKLAHQQRAFAMLGRERITLNDLLRELDRLEGIEGGERAAQQIEKIERQIESTRRRMEAWKAEIRSAGQVAFRAFSGAVTSLQQIGELPRGITAAMRRMAFDFQRETGKLLTPAQLRHFFQIAVDPTSLRRANAQMRAFIDKWRKQKATITVQTKLARGQTPTEREILGMGRGPLRRRAIEIPIKPKVPRLRTGADIFAGLKLLTTNVTPKPKDVGKAKKDLEGAFKTPITQQIQATPPSQAALIGIGQRITAGIQSGMESVTQRVTVSKVINTTVQEFDRQGKGRSPYMLFAQEVGIPISQGIAVGVLQGVPYVERAGRQMMAALPKGMFVAFNDVMEMIDLFQGRVLSRLAEPMEVTFFGSEFLQELEQNIESAKKKLTDARKTNDAEARKFIRARITPAHLTRDLQVQVTQLQSFNYAMTRLARRGVPRELLMQLSQLGTEGAEKLRILADSSNRELRKYVGAWRQAQAQIARASRITVRDLQADLNTQLTDFRAFNTAMTKLGRKPIPIELFSQLAQGGVENLKMIQALARATPKELAKYVKAWTAATQAMNRFATMPAWEEILQKNRDFMRQLFDPSEISSRLKTIADDFRNAFGQIFSGPRNLRSMIGEELASATASWQSEMASLQKELQDAYGELAEAQAQYAKDIAEEQARNAKDVADAIAEYNKDVTDQAAKYAKEVSEANLQMTKDLAEESTRYHKDVAEAQAKAIQDRFEELRSAFGDVFSNVEEMFKDKIEWGIALGMDDLKASLQAQVDLFRKWRTALANLIARGLPTELMADLEKLGPRVTGMLETLVGATDADLTEWVNLWKSSHTEIKAIASTATADTTDILARYNEAIAQIDARNVETLAELAASNNEALQELAQKHSETMRDLDERHVENMREINERFASTVADIMERIADINQRIAQTAAEMPRKLTFADIFADLQAQIELFQRWTTSLQTLINRGLPYKLIEQIRELGPEATEIIEVLANATDAEIKEYVALWERGGVILGDAIATWSKHITPDLILGGMKEAVAQWDQWQGTLTNLTARLNTELTTQFGKAGSNMRVQLMNELRQMGPEALPYLTALNNMTDAQLREFVALWVAGGGKIRDASRAEYEEQLRIWAENGRALARGFLIGVIEMAPNLAKMMGITIKGVAASAYLDSADTYYGIGSSLGSSMVNGVLSQAAAMRAAIASMQQGIDMQPFGAAIPTAVAQGIQQTAGNLAQTAQQLASTSVMQPFASKIQAESPSKVFRRFGENIVQGLILGMKTAGSITPDIGKPSYNGRSTGQSQQQPVNMYITAHQDESLISTLERARFRLINRR